MVMKILGSVTRGSHVEGQGMSSGTNILIFTYAVILMFKWYRLYVGLVTHIYY